MKIKLKIKQLNAEEVRRGWVRIHENSRRGIPAGSLVKITYNSKFVRRIVLGATNKSPVSEGYIAMDEPTRKKLGVEEHKSKEFDIEEYKGVKKIGGEICYYWSHPDFPLRFSTRIAFIAVTLGFLSIIISVVGIIW